MPTVVSFIKRVRPAESARVVWTQWLMPARVMKEHDLKIGESFALTAQVGKRTFAKENCYIGQKNFFFVGVDLAEKLKRSSILSMKKEIKFEAVFFRSIATALMTKEEGDEVIRTMKALERNTKIAKAVKDANRTKNNGVIICEACDLVDKRSSMFDSHHLDPLCTGQRQSQIISFAVLCPTCHRWSHVSGVDRYHPLPVAEVRKARAIRGRILN